MCFGKEKYNQCNILKNLLDEKGIRYYYLDMLEMPHKTTTYLKMYCSNYPVALSANYLIILPIYGTHIYNTLYKNMSHSRNVLYQLSYGIKF